MEASGNSGNGSLSQSPSQLRQKMFDNIELRRLDRQAEISLLADLQEACRVSSV
jgi:hypothetical protein